MQSNDDELFKCYMRTQIENANSNIELNAAKKISRVEATEVSNGMVQVHEMIGSFVDVRTEWMCFSELQYFYH